MNWNPFKPVRDKREAAPQDHAWQVQIQVAVEAINESRLQKEYERFTFELWPGKQLYVDGGITIDPCIVLRVTKHEGLGTFAHVALLPSLKVKEVWEQRLYIRKGDNMSNPSHHPQP
jgi:hypothetical protein